MLSIPPNASPENYVQNYRPPAPIGTKRKSGSIRSNGVTGAKTAVSAPDSTEPSRKKKKSEMGLAAVMMDDAVEEGELSDEIFDDDDDEEEDDNDDDEELGLEDGSGMDVASDISGMLGIGSAEEGEIMEISSPEYLKAKATKRSADRNESVSHDSDDYEIQPSAASARGRAGLDEGSDSRYSVSNKGKARRTAKAELTASVGGSDSESDSAASSDSPSIVALSGPTKTDQRKNGPQPITDASASDVAGGAATRPKNGVGKKAKRDFWRAKAGKKDDGPEDAEDDFGGGADFVKL
jgi:hypothetical protein